MAEKSNDGKNVDLGSDVDIRLISSPNWFCHRMIDCDAGSNLLAYGSRGSVVIVKINSEKRSCGEASRCSVNSNGTQIWTSARLLHRLHSDRISGVCFDHITHSHNQNEGLRLATVGEDLLVHVICINYDLQKDGVSTDDIQIDPQTGTSSFHVIGSHRQHKTKIAAVTWSKSTNDLSSCVLSGDEDGNLILYNITSGKIRTYKPSTNTTKVAPLTCLTACPSKPHLVAIGYKGGLIIVIDLGTNGDTVWFLRHHDDDIQSLCWAPFVGLGPFDPGLIVERSIEKADNCDDRLFVSGSKDKTFRIWSTIQGAPIRTLNLPTNSRSGGCGRKRTGDEFKVNPWVTCHWPEGRHHILLTGSHLGDFIEFDLRTNDRDSNHDRNWSIVGNKDGKNHSKTIFNIVACNGIVCTVSMDRQIMFWDIYVEPARWLFSMPTLGGTVHCLTFSPINPGFIAIGCGDNMIRTWNTMSTSSQYDVQSFWQGIKSKVTALCWHPRKEGLIAFGTIEGRVAVCSVLSNKVPSLSKNFHRNVVYTLIWGPLCPRTDNENDWRFYSCGDGVIMMHDPNKLDATALNLDKIISCAQTSKDTRQKTPFRTEVTFKPDYDILVIGNGDGTLELYDTSTLMLTVVVCAPRKLIQCVRWHPKYTMSSCTESPYSSWMAVASRDSTIHVHDLSEHLLLSNVTVTQKKTSASFVLWGHCAAVTTVAWSPHRDGQLVSASFDGTVRVWNVVNMETLACFCGHASSRVLCAEWNPLDADLVASGGEDFTLRMWKISEQRKQSTLSASGRRDLYKIQPRKVIDKCDIDGSDEMGSSNELGELNKEQLVWNELEELLERRRQDILNDSSVDSTSLLTNRSGKEVSNESNIKEQVSVLSVQNKNVDPVSQNQGQWRSQSNVSKKSEASKKKKRAFKSMFPLSNSSENSGKSSLLNDCLYLADRIDNVEQSLETFESNHLVRLGAYGGRLDAYRLLKLEGDHHQKNDNDEYAMYLDIWKGNVAGVIRNAAERDQLNDWLVAMAPIVSHSFWEEMSLLFSQQLVVGGQPHKAVTFMLANQKVREAVEILKKHVSFKEAIILAKTRLSADDPLIKELMEEWAAHLEREGQAEQAAKCYLSLGRLEKAATILAQRQDAASLRTAAYIIRKASGIDSATLAIEYAVRASFESIVKDDYTFIETVNDENSELKPFQLVVETQRLLKESLSEPFCNEESNDACLLHKIYINWQLNCSSLIEGHQSFDKAIWILSQDPLTTNPHKSQQMTAYLAVRLSLALVFALKSQYSESLRTIVTVTVLLRKFGDQNLVAWLFRRVLPDLDFCDGMEFNYFNFLNLDMKSVSICDMELIKALRAYREITILGLIVDKVKQSAIFPLKFDSDVTKDDDIVSVKSNLSLIIKNLLELINDCHLDVAKLTIELSSVKVMVNSNLSRCSSDHVVTVYVDTESKADIVIELVTDAFLKCLNPGRNRIKTRTELSDCVRILLNSIPILDVDFPFNLDRLLFVAVVLLTELDEGLYAKCLKLVEDENVLINPIQ